MAIVWTPFVERCVWNEHVWGEVITVEVGRHDTRGPYRRLTRECRRCPSVMTETVWEKELTHARIPTNMSRGD